MITAGICALGAMMAGLVVPLVTQKIIDGPVRTGDVTTLVWLVLAVLGLGIVEAALLFARRQLSAPPNNKAEAGMRAALYAHLQRLPLGFHDSWQSGQLLSRGVDDVATIRRFMTFTLIYLVINTTTIFVGLGIMFTLAPVLGLVVTVCMLPVLVSTYFYETRYRVVARRAQDQAGDLATTVEESVLGIRVLKAFGRGKHLRGHYLRQAADLRETGLRKISVLAVLWATIIVLPGLAIAAQLAAGAHGIANGTITLGTLVAAITLTTFLTWPVESLGWFLAELNSAAAACERFGEVADTEPIVTDPAEPKPLPDPLRGELRFEGVRMRYPAAETDVLSTVDLTLHPGETVALVGATGCGKTTLTALVPRFYDVSAGRITLDGTDIRELSLHDLRGRIAVAFEEAVLFSATVRENVAMGTHRPTTEDEVREALRVANAEDFVDALPQGLDTPIGEQGLSLSGGQRQRLALARAVISRPAVLVLDDPLSALDVHTEAEVEQALRSVLRGVTALVVAHRPSTVQLADRVAVLHEGRIVATGTHRELLASSTVYRTLLSTMDDQPSELEDLEVTAR
ncbi:ABC transporter ATP-binding protein/permease [Allokutzneria sp. A3M-2-11 16]|uniref:ABC transporter ATP-binding protein n=1 Tax=Allokutzneria sp. A3M-2-11 16 TaxID=2962043 RepID=UPI0020B6C67E|nr:ABC transporter ATP-binding protein [Allokutzneria sp. A3M-2-11 16]MCP3800135.1 ABC transporter ATP-binding protein/permease [Allokutzneria sp. A3M-2-11 16]